MDVDKIIAAIPGRTDDERGRMRANAERCIADGPEKMRDAAQQVIEALDQQAVDDATAFDTRIASMGPMDRLVAALAAFPPTKMETKLLSALLNTPQSTAQELSVLCGWQGRIWYKRLEAMCTKRAAYLASAEPGAATPDNTGVELFVEMDSADDRFTMTAEAVAALAQHKIKAKIKKAA